jgi:hypothetical protein
MTAHQPPRTFSDLDYVRYSLLFPNTEFLISSEGTWTLVRWQDCSALKSDTCTCTLQGTVAKPRICTTFNPHNCWYKRNLVTSSPPDLYRLDLARFEVWVKEIVLDDSGTIVAVPSFEEAQALLKEIAVQPAFTMDERLHKPGPADGVPANAPRSEASA